MAERLTRKDTLKSVTTALGLCAVLGGALVIGSKASEQAAQVGERLNAAAQRDGFDGVHMPVFVEKAGRATSSLNLGKCIVRPLTMVYHERSSQVENITYMLEAPVYLNEPHNKQLNQHVNNEGMLELTFHNSAELHDQVGGDPCTALDPVLTWRNLRTS